MEILKDLDSIEEYKVYTGYKVSNTGKVYSINKNKKEWKELKQSIGSHGYKVVGLRAINAKHPKVVKVHRLVAFLFVDNLDNKPKVDHIDNDKLNNSVDNLRWVTVKENLDYFWSNPNFCNKTKEKIKNGLREFYANNTVSIETRQKMRNAKLGKKRLKKIV